MRPEHIKPPSSTSHVILATVLIAFSLPAWSNDFRNSRWGATVSEVMQAEKAELTAREETENGSYAIRYAAELLGQTMEIAYFFDSTCKRLVAGSLSFAEPLSETQFLMIIRTFTNIYGEGPPSTSLNGGHILKWQNDESEIQFLHLPHGVEVPELDHLPRSLVSYRYLESNPPSCDIGND